MTFAARAPDPVSARLGRRRTHDNDVDKRVSRYKVVGLDLSPISVGMSRSGNQKR